MKRTVVVTGGCGFIGSHLVDACLARGYETRVIDDLSVGRLANLAHHGDHPKLSILQADVADRAAIEPVFAGADWVFHLAGRADIVPSIQMPEVYHRANVDGTVAVLEASRAHGVDRFVYAASSSCYGIPERYPTPETAPADPRYPYALSKYVGEQYVMHWCRVYKLPAISLRFFNVFGPRARTNGTYGAVFGVFLSQRHHGLPLTIVGDGTQTRDFTYVTDVVAALLASAESTLSGEIFNVGSDGSYSVNELVQLIGGERTYVPKRPGEPDCTFADITKIKTLLGWRPQVTFPEGVKRLLADLGDWKEAPLWTPDTIRGATADWFRYLS